MIPPKYAVLFTLVKDVGDALFLTWAVSGRSTSLTKLFDFQHFFHLNSAVMDLFTLALLRVVFCFVSFVIVCPRLYMKPYFFGDEDDSEDQESDVDRTIFGYTQVSTEEERGRGGSTSTPAAAPAVEEGEGSPASPSHPDELHDEIETNENGYVYDYLRRRCARRQRNQLVHRILLCSALFFFSACAFFVSIKCLNFAFPADEKRMTSFAMAMIVVWVNMELYFVKSHLDHLRNDVYDDYRPDMHMHPVQFTTQSTGFICDTCREFVGKEGFKCPTCKQDICKKCFLTHPRATPEEQRALLEGRSPHDAQQEERQTGPRSTAFVRRTLQLMRPLMGWILVSFVGVIVNQVTRLSLSNLQGKVIDSILQGTVAAFRRELIVYVIVMSITLLLGCLKNFCATYVTRHIRVNLRQLLFDNLIYGDMHFFDSAKVGSLTSRMTTDTENMIDPLEQLLNSALSNVIALIGSLVMCLFISWRLALISFTIFGPVIYMSRAYTLWSWKIWRNIFDAYARASSVATECFRNVRTIRAFSSELIEIKRYGTHVHDALKGAVRDAFIFASVDITTNFASSFSNVLTLAFGGYMVLRPSHELTVGQLVTYQLYTNTMTQALQDLLSVFNSFTSCAGATQRVFGLMDVKSVHQYNEGDALLQVDGRLSLRNVSFTYPSRPAQQILRDVSIDFPPSKVTALVGRSGGGKSTIMHLLLRLYDPVEGQVLLQGRDLRELSLPWYHNQVAVVSQDTQLFNTTIADNISYGSPHCTSEAIVQAAKDAFAADFIKDLPEGYNTIVGENGGRLSGGQRQRIAIARALLRRPQLLFLDEATSALDAESEAQVQRALDQLLQNAQTRSCTVVVIAHRLSTIQNADNIIVLDGGQVVEQGRHDELLAKSGSYHSLVEHQLKTGVMKTTKPVAITPEKELDNDSMQNAEAAITAALLPPAVPEKKGKSLKEGEEIVEETEDPQLDSITNRKGGSSVSSLQPLLMDTETLSQKKRREDLRRKTENEFDRSRTSEPPATPPQQPSPQPQKEETPLEVSAPQQPEALVVPHDDNVEDKKKNEEAAPAPAAAGGDDQNTDEK